MWWWNISDEKSVIDFNILLNKSIITFNKYWKNMKYLWTWWLKYKNLKNIKI